MYINDENIEKEIQNRLELKATMFSTNLSSKISMDLNRNKRKHVGRDHKPSEFSQHSILSAMDRFVQAVNNMDNTIMVPSRLLDMSYQTDAALPSENIAVVPRALMNTDFYSFYMMLNAVKTELIWGAANKNQKENGSNNGKLPLARRISTISVHSCSDSDLESVSSTEFDSGLELDEQSVQIADSFSQHLSGLFHLLHQLTESANFLTSRYQDEVGGI